MYIVNSTVKIPEGKVDEVVSIYQNRSRMVDQFKGFISFQLLQNEVKLDELTVQIRWESKEAYLNWARSDAFKKIHDLEKAYPDQELAQVRPLVRRYKVVAE